MPYSLDFIKTCRSSFVLISTHNITVYKGFTFNECFRYSERNGFDPSFPFWPSDVCADVDGNFLVIDSNDDTVHQHFKSTLYQTRQISGNAEK